VDGCDFVMCLCTDEIGFEWLGWPPDHAPVPLKAIDLGKDSRMISPLTARCVCICLAFSAIAADFKTRNFVVSAPTPEIAEQVGRAAEVYRRELSIEWLGEEMPAWAKPCPITVKVGQIGAGGATTFNFGGGHVYGWKMTIQGTLERILDSVLPHEISHTIYACHFRCPLPRWADEGASTLCEHDSEKSRQVQTVLQVLNTPRRIPLRKLMAMKEYPSDMQDVLTLYAQGYSLADLLVQQGGKPKFLAFLKEAMQSGYDPALAKFYRYESTEVFEREWLKWVVAGSPAFENSNIQYAAASPAKAAAAQGKALPLVRAQNSDEELTGSRGAVAMVTPPVAPRSPRRGDGLEAPAPKIKASANPRPSVESNREFASLGEPDAANIESDEPIIERPLAPRRSEEPVRIAALETTPSTAVRTADLTPRFDWTKQDRQPPAKRPSEDRSAAEVDEQREVVLEGEPDPVSQPAQPPRQPARATPAVPTRLAAADSPASRRPPVKRRIPKYSEAYVEPGSRALPDYVP
jgi:hypothetical protein